LALFHWIFQLLFKGTLNKLLSAKVMTKIQKTNFFRFKKCLFYPKTFESQNMDEQVIFFGILDLFASLHVDQAIKTFR